MTIMGEPDFCTEFDEASSGVMRVAKALTVTPTAPAPTPGDSLLALVKAAQLGDTKARDRVVAALMPLLRLIAHSYKHPEFVDDLVQAGIVGEPGKKKRGLLRAIETFNPEGGARFASWAGQWIRSAMRRELAKALGKGPEQSHRIRARTQLVRRTARKLQAEQGGQPPTAVDVLIAVRGDYRERLTLAAVERALLPDQRCAGLEALADHGSGSEGATVATLDARRQLRDVAELVAALPDQQARVMRAYYGIEGRPMLMREIAAQEGLSTSQVERLIRDGGDHVRAGVFGDE